MELVEPEAVWHNLCPKMDTDDLGGTVPLMTLLRKLDDKAGYQRVYRCPKCEIEVSINYPPPASVSGSEAVEPSKVAEWFLVHARALRQSAKALAEGSREYAEAYFEASAETVEDFVKAANWTGVTERTLCKRCQDEYAEPVPQPAAQEIAPWRALVQAIEQLPINATSLAVLRAANDYREAITRLPPQPAPSVDLEQIARALDLLDKLLAERGHGTTGMYRPKGYSAVLAIAQASLAALQRSREGA